MRILVTGGNGYVGRTLTRSLYEAHDVTVVDSLRSGPIRFRADERSRFSMRQIDVRDFEAVAGAVANARPELLIHLAAIHFIPECDREPDEAIAVNTLGTANVARACPEGARLVFVSTAAVYAPDTAPHVEATSPVGPTDVYGLTKAHAEQYLAHWARTKQLRVGIVRLFNVIGPGETNPHLVPAILAQLLRGTRTLRLGNAHPKRDYIHVADAAEGIARIAYGLSDRAGVDVVNLGTGACHSVLDVVSEFGRVIGEELDVESDPERTRVSDRPVLVASVTKLRRDYGWAPTRTLSDSVRDLWREPDVSEDLLRRC